MVITRDESVLVTSTPTVRVSDIGDAKRKTLLDHHQVYFDLSLGKPGRQRKHITFRQYKDFSLSDFKRDAVECVLDIPSAPDFNAAVEKYHSQLVSTLDKHAPLVSKQVTLRPDCKWFTEENHQAKMSCRLAEKKMRDSDLHIHQEIFDEMYQLTIT